MRFIFLLSRSTVLTGAILGMLLSGLAVWQTPSAGSGTRPDSMPNRCQVAAVARRRGCGGRAGGWQGGGPHAAASLLGRAGQIRRVLGMA
jgi:hypothetical protein